MPALSFKKEFVPAVENGVAWLDGRPFPHPGIVPKFQTIRAHRKRPFQKGDVLYLYTGMRTKACRKLGEVECTEVQRIRLSLASLCFGQLLVEIQGPRGAWHRMTVADSEAFAVKDGFRRLFQMKNFFQKKHGLPFEGELVRWGEK